MEEEIKEDSTMEVEVVEKQTTKTAATANKYDR